MAQISASCDPGEPFYIFVCEAKAHRHCRPKRGADRALAEGGGCGDMPRKDDDFGEVCALGSSWHFVAQMTRGRLGTCEPRGCGQDLDVVLRHRRRRVL